MTSWGEADRDRESDGRPRQARPRDELGRPLPYGAAGVEPVSEQPLPPMDTIAEVDRLMVEGRPFAAHEVLEARWKEGPIDERELWQGLAQLCVAITHAARGNRRGAGRVLARGVDRLTAYQASGAPRHGLDLDAVLARGSGMVLSGMTPAELLLSPPAASPPRGYSRPSH